MSGENNPVGEAPLRSLDIFDVIVIGSGAGSVTAAGAARRVGRRVALVRPENGPESGPESDNDSGPAPDRLGQAHRATGGLVEAAAALRRARSVGVAGVSSRAEFEPRRLFTALAEAVEATDGDISLDLLAGQGVEVLSGATRFTAASRIEVGGRTLQGRRFLLALGALQPTYGLGSLPHLTPGMLPGLDACPARLVVAGNGTRAVELAQAFATLGSAVTLLHCEERLLHDLEPEAAAMVKTALRRAGVDVHEAVEPVGGSTVPGGITVRSADGRTFEGTDLLLAGSVAPDTSRLGLELAGVATGPTGYVVVDDRLRAPAAAHVYAIGDSISAASAPHLADEQGFAAVQHVLAEERPRRLVRPADRLLRADPGLWLSRWNPSGAPVRLRAAPEVACAGIREAEAAESYGKRARVAVVPLAAIGGSPGEGFVKLVAVPGLFGARPLLRLAGITVVGPHAGEVLAQGTLAVQSGMPVYRLAQTQPLDGALSAVVRLAASLFFAPRHGLCDRPAGRPGDRQN